MVIHGVTEISKDYATTGMNAARQLSKVGSFIQPIRFAMDLSELRVYASAMDFGEMVWNLTSNWDSFARDTVGKQLIRSTDSIAANISEGFGRYHYKENLQFCYYARGSLYETITWIQKSANRGLIDRKLHAGLETELEVLGKMLNRYISSIGKHSTTNDQ